MRNLLQTVANAADRNAREIAQAFEDEPTPLLDGRFFERRPRRRIVREDNPDLIERHHLRVAMRRAEYGY